MHMVFCILPLYVSYLFYTSFNLAASLKNLVYFIKQELDVAGKKMPPTCFRLAAFL